MNAQKANNVIFQWNLKTAFVEKGIHRTGWDHPLVLAHKPQLAIRNCQVNQQTLTLGLNKYINITETPPEKALENNGHPYL